MISLLPEARYECLDPGINWTSLYTQTITKLFLTAIICIVAFYATFWFIGCVVCFRSGPSIFQKKFELSTPQSNTVINQRLSPFRKLPSNFHDTKEERCDPDGIEEIFGGQGHTRSLLEQGYPVGGKHEKIIHVTYLHPQGIYDGYVSRFFSTVLATHILELSISTKTRRRRPFLSSKLSTPGTNSTD